MCIHLAVEDHKGFTERQGIDIGRQKSIQAQEKKAKTGEQEDHFGSGGSNCSAGTGWCFGMVASAG